MKPTRHTAGMILDAMRGGKNYQ